MLPLLHIVTVLWKLCILKMSAFHDPRKRALFLHLSECCFQIFQHVVNWFIYCEKRENFFNPQMHTEAFSSSEKFKYFTGRQLHEINLNYSVICQLTVIFFLVLLLFLSHNGTFRNATFFTSSQGFWIKRVCACVWKTERERMKSYNIRNRGFW